MLFETLTRRFDTLWAKYRKCCRLRSVISFPPSLLQVPNTKVSLIDIKYDWSRVHLLWPIGGWQMCSGDLSFSSPLGSLVIFRQWLWTDPLPKPSFLMEIPYASLIHELILTGSAKSGSNVSASTQAVTPTQPVTVHNNILTALS